MKVVVLCSDVMFRSKLRDAITRAGLEPLAATSAPETSDLAAAVVDLGEARFDPVAAVRALRAQHESLPILGFASHVRDDLLASGRSAGCSEVVPRSKALESLESLLALLARPT